MWTYLPLARQQFRKPIVRQDNTLPRQRSQIYQPFIESFFVKQKISWTTKVREVLDILLSLAQLPCWIHFKVSMNVVTKALKYTIPQKLFSILKEGLLYMAWEGQYQTYFSLHVFWRVRVVGALCQHSAATPTQPDTDHGFSNRPAEWYLA
jgi:hypothetical protein